MSASRDNHYVPQWYQKGFVADGQKKLHRLDLSPETNTLEDGRVITLHEYHYKAPSQCFYQTDLYTTFFGPFINDEIETKLFGKIDDTGSKAVRAFIEDDLAKQHRNFQNFFGYLDSQKIRTPKGLDWIRIHYPGLSQLDLMVEMQSLRNMHCTIWAEGVREIVSAKKSKLKFICSDHPVTIYNYACSPDDSFCAYPNEPSIALKGTQTVFPLDKDHCLILTNLEYAESPENENPLERRTHARNFGNSMVRTDAFIRTRQLTENDVRQINCIIKARARRYIAASEKEWLWPERGHEFTWRELRKVLLPPKNELHRFGGEMYFGYKDGSTQYQDAYGRSTPENPYLKKSNPTRKLRPNDPCNCGSGKKFKACCRDKPESARPRSDVLSIRERNLRLCAAVTNILGLSEGKSWEDVRRQLSNEHVKKIHQCYGFFWPKETDLASLLPKPDGALRALYTGVIDPQVICEFAISSTLYFDEILIQHPFINPNNVNPEFSPVKFPSLYKRETLKNVILLLALQPFIEMGYVNFIPDPCSFDQYLRHQMFSMAEERRGDFDLSAREEKRLKKIQQEEVRRATLMLPRHVQASQLKRANPHLSKEQVDEALDFMEQEKLADPYVLLQEDVYAEKGGQLCFFHMSPNFEISLFLAQLTGSLLITDSDYRWAEITKAQSTIIGTPRHDWLTFEQQVASLNHPLNINPEITLRLRHSGKFGNLRKVTKGLVSSVIAKHQTTKNMEISDSISKRYAEALAISATNIGDVGNFGFSGRYQYFIPEGGLVSNNVQRLLISTGNQNCWMNVPIAVFMSSAREKQTET